MSVETKVKICGVTRQEDIDFAISLGADYIGLNFYPPSPRSISFDRAASLTRRSGCEAPLVAVLVDPSDDQIEALLREVDIDILQLHGQETPARVARIKARTGKTIIKVLRVATRGDIEPLPTHLEFADMIMFDAKPPPDPSVLPGGNGLSFDWRLLTSLTIDKPWALAGGLTPDNVMAAIELTGAPIVDVASGVEASPGVKDKDRLCTFLKAAKSTQETPSKRPQPSAVA